MMRYKETEKRGLQPQDLLKISWMQARLGGINYILRKREVLGFGFRTAFVSVSYLDRFLSIRDVDKPWAIRLMSMACLSLAAKMEERRVPALSEFSEDLYFASSTIKRMELLVLQTLEWEMGAITPFDFIHFFADKLLDKRTVSANAVSKSVLLILDTMRDAKIMCNRPSVIAAAATLFVLDQGLTREAVEMKISPLNSTHHFSIESIISCYGLFQEIERLKNHWMLMYLNHLLIKKLIFLNKVDAGMIKIEDLDLQLNLNKVDAAELSLISHFIPVFAAVFGCDLLLLYFGCN